MNSEVVLDLRFGELTHVPQFSESQIAAAILTPFPVGNQPISRWPLLPLPVPQLLRFYVYVLAGRLCVCEAYRHHNYKNMRGNRWWARMTLKGIRLRLTQKGGRSASICCWAMAGMGAYESKHRTWAVRFDALGCVRLCGTLA